MSLDPLSASENASLARDADEGEEGEEEDEEEEEDDDELSRDCLRLSFRSKAIRPTLGLPHAWQESEAALLINVHVRHAHPLFGVAAAAPLPGSAAAHRARVSGCVSCVSRGPDLSSYGDIRAFPFTSRLFSCVRSSIIYCQKP